LPLYEYKCAKCAHQFEKIEKHNAPTTQRCPKCGGKAERMISAAGIQFKGSGWYVTEGSGDGASGKSGESSSDSKSADAKSQDSKSSDAKTGESKSGGAKSGESKSSVEKGSSKKKK
jgi:putative FmdB family regulatory protein